MSASQFDVVIVGGGCAGMSAAIGLARSGFAVAVVESAAFPGAENWSGCVYFCENLAHPDLLGPEGVEALAWERRLVERGAFATDGHGLLGMSYRDPQAFRHCYTVLRPIFDHHLAQVAVQLGVALLTDTTAESLIRDGNRVVGVCTQRGPLYADLVFLAEGDASHLVTREGYERFPNQREAPKFLQGIKQVIELPPGAIEETFHVGPEEGVAYEMLLRNGTLRGRDVHLNMGGFVYTNRQSLSIGLVLPADHLRDHFDGDPNLLVEWFEKLPALAPWLKDGRRGVFGAKIIRGGGARDIPRLVDDGLAIGGAASAIGIDFPYPNFTGPATRMGLILVQAARRIREEKGRFSQANLERHYLQPLQNTHYWKDVEFLRRWPGYVKKTTAFFGSHLDLALGSAYVWTRPNRWFLTKWLNWLRLAWEVAGPTHWQDLRADMQHLSRALQLTEVVGQPSIWRFMLDGTVNALRDLSGSPRPHLQDAGSLSVHYTVAGGGEPSGPPSRLLRRWFERFLPVLAAAALRVYRNDEEPLAAKLKNAVGLLVRQVNILDVFAAAALALATGIVGGFLAVCARMRSVVRGRRIAPAGGGLYRKYARAARQATDLTPVVVPAAQHWEARLGQLAYASDKESHIHVLWPKSLPDKNAVVGRGLWHVCPAHVYEARLSPLGQLQVVVNFENCIKCETCWRTSDLVDWGRDGRHRFIYPVHSPAVERLRHAAGAAGAARPMLPHAVDWWQPAVHDLADRLRNDRPALGNGHYAAELAELTDLLDKLERKLEEFDEALAEEPRTVDRARADYLEKLARYAQQLASRIHELLAGGNLAESPRPAVAQAQRQLLSLAAALLKRTEERARRTWDQRYSWASADGRQARMHHLVGLRRLLGLLGSAGATPQAALAAAHWRRAEVDAVDMAVRRHDWAAQLDAVFPALAWRDLDRGTPLTSEQDALLRDLLAQVPAIDPGNLAATLHPPVRKALLAELGRRNPSLAYRVACHMWARDLARLAGAGFPSLRQASERWTRGDEWAAFLAIDGVQDAPGTWTGDALFVPARGARSLLLLMGDQLAVVPVPTEARAGLTVEPLATLGLRGAGMAHVRLDHLVLPQRQGVDHARMRRAWSVLSAADLTSIASGMADVLCERTIAHATGRVQFPGLFHDEESRDTIGKFGAVKKMVAEMAVRRFLLDTLDHVLSPVDFSTPSVGQAGLVKVLVAEALGTAPGSLAYNAGQVFGGTGFSEDDILAMYYRDAAAWRFVGPPNVDVLRQHGDELLHSWRSDGQRLASFPGEAELFDQMAQRKALQNELDQVRVFRSHLRGLVNEWLAAGGASTAATLSLARLAVEVDRRPTFSPHAGAEVSEGLARADANLLACKALLLRLHARLERGLHSETETALVRVWLQEASVALEDFESCLRLQFALAAQRDDHPIVDPTAGPPVTVYADYLASAMAYDSGAFLDQPVDLLQPRFVPEMIEADPALNERSRAIREQVAGYFGAPRNGLSYERHVERQHHPDAADLDFCRRHGYFRMPIPKELGGEARPKVDYYLLTTSCQRLADVAVSLTIQVNTSLGTTPVLLARDKDIPRARKELTRFAEDSGLHTEIGKRLVGLSAMIGVYEPGAIQKAYNDLHTRLEETVLKSAALKALAHRFVDAWHLAGVAGKEFDLPAVRLHLELAGTLWKHACQRAAEQAQEFERRREACDLFLRWVAAGQISAFALTEPSAGSDTARVATRAVLRSVPVEREADGVYRFVPVGLDQPRILLDARLLEFRFDQRDGQPEYRAFYRSAPTADPVPIQFDEYDYETDDARRQRYVLHGERKVHFTDIAQLRERDGRSFFDYWELTGSKMWITNGRMAGVMCLYAKTDEGITGFLVDRHAEGLVVGKDEDKLGQCGSPTNELSLQMVRVPRENVIGIEGRGQVNALETLNVGRAGLAMSAMAQMAGLIEQSRKFAATAYGIIPAWVEWRLQRMEAERFTSEALAHEVIGRFEHPQTKSVRLESAIAKALVSESLHRVIEWAEDIFGLAGQTQLHLVEKRKRDARVLNIYEGTNEIQRFFILKDLAATRTERGKKDERKTQHTSPEALELETLRLNVRQRIAAALETFGQDLWQNPNLQANCFLLAEAVAWFKAADSALGRLAWCERVANGSGAEAVGPAVPAGPTLPPSARYALLRCSFEVRDRLRRFDEELTHLRRGFYAEEVRAAALLFHRTTPARSSVGLSTRITRPLSVLVVLEPNAAAVPHPHVEDGRIVETYWSLTAADRAVLETALRLRDQAVAGVDVQTVAVGPRSLTSVLREALSLGIDRARLLVPETDTPTTDSAALALAAVLRGTDKFDLVLGGSGAADHEDGLLARLTAEGIGVPFAGSAAQLAVRATESEAEATLVGAEQQQNVRSLPAAVAIEPVLSLRPFTIEGYLTGLAKTVEVERWPRRVNAREILWTEGAPVVEAADEAGGVPLEPDEAALQIFEAIGLHAGSSAALAPYPGDVEDVTSPALVAGRVLALLAADAEGRLEPTAAVVVQAARLLADRDHREVAVLLLVPASEETQRRTVAQLRTFTAVDVVLLSTDRSVESPEIRGQLLRECWPSGPEQPRMVVGEPWAEPALITLALASDAPSLLALRLRRVSRQVELIAVETSRAQGKLRAVQIIPAGLDRAGWLTLTADAEVSGAKDGQERPAGKVQRWAPRLERFFGRDEIRRLLDAVKAEVGVASLADAEFIIDVGFGVGNRDGFEAVIEPLQKALVGLGVRRLVIGGSRKVTEELHLLPADRQIGQSGVSVNPRVLLAIGVSGAPQHLNYIGPRATVLAFNRDSEAPIMTLNRRQPRPRVFPVVGDLFETVPALIAALRQEAPTEAPV